MYIYFKYKYKIICNVKIDNFQQLSVVNYLPFS